MQDLIRQERFEIEVLDRLRSGRFLDSLIFTGGTMLRLCYGLNRFSIDLDFYLYKEIDARDYFRRLKEYLSRYYVIKDAENKFYTMIFEIKSKDFPRSLKIEIRKKTGKFKTDLSIAYSKYADKQVLVRSLSLEEVMMSKIEAFLGRKEIRDVFDMEFLVKRGIEIKASKDEIKRLIDNILSLKKKDYSVKLGSILEAEDRRYYSSENFKILVMKLQEKI
ncbi:hypothetical protein JZK55_17760 [Dissulfurispira thermophila]|uniref:Nucleotidyl transferase AbiEii/AbiGii toxin family protein n=1 Tax=Dissulfurispira thermophila TaxID=2715679 RepID=A0A7G1H228_9BACT|nr:nucleotidyl transferase AbiEii/AbiGii toxin family protein [Dissulfurispira thermophila]BCB96854.1 hypothetical protein JZK55_17760 [Dissulfurispira thermophila]